MCGNKSVRIVAVAGTVETVVGDDRPRSWGMNTSLNVSVWPPLAGEAGQNESSAPIISTYSITQTVVIGTLATFFSIITVVGNIMVMISFKIDKQLQTISNYFLFSLAVADFAIGLISMPLFTVSILLGYWPLGPLICDTWLALDYLASNASVLNLLIISFDRYFSVTRPLTYRVKRTTSRAAYMIGSAWGISLLLWPPWIYSWPYIEGERTVPDNQCYIQFIETNHYITFGTAIAAFYVPVTVMCCLYWRIWRETEKRQKDLPNLQAGKKDSSKRSNSRVLSFSDEANNTCATLHQHELGEEWRRPSCTTDGSLGGGRRGSTYGSRANCRTNTTLGGVYGVRRWCVQWWHSGREDNSDAEDTPSELMAGGATTPVSVETPLQSSVSRCTSLNVIRDPYISTYAQMTPTRLASSGCSGGTISSNMATSNCLEARDSRSLPTSSAARLRPSMSTESVYTILIRLPSEPSGTNGSTETTDLQPSIKMIPESSNVMNSMSRRTNEPNDFYNVNHLNRRPSQMPDIRIPLNAKIIPKQLADKSLLATGGKQVVKKKKKSQEKKADKKAAKTLSAILLTFIITWTPYNILVLIKPLTACTSCIPQQLWDFFYYLCYINSTINPMCYALCNASFRRTYLRILKCKWQTRNRTAMNRGYYG